MLLMKHITGDLYSRFGGRAVFKGGGGSTTTQSSGIDPEFKPYLKDVLSDVTQRYKADVAGGPDAIVAKLDPRQLAALGAQTTAAQQAISGQGVFDTQAEAERMLKNVQGTTALGQSSGQTSSLSSARAEKAREGAMSDRALDLARERQQALMGGIQSLGEAGTSLQEYEQARLDSPHTAAQRYFGYLGNAPQQTTATTSGGGK